MDAQQFLAEFGYIANATGGVARLREMIRAFAVRGDLIQHFAPWRECTLGSLGDWAIGCGFPKQEQGQEGNDILFAKVSDMNLPGNEKFIANTVNTITKETSERLRIKIHPPGTVIFPKIGGAISTNKRRIVSRPTAIDNNCLGLIPKGEATTEWLFLVLSSIDFSQYQVGTSVPALSQGIIAEIQCFLPSEEEQSRIVAKVDELMALCDKLEAQQQQRRRLQNNLRQSTLQAVAAATNPQELHTAWNRLADNFDQLFHVPEDARALRDVIFDLAMRGMFLPTTKLSSPVTEDDLAPLPTGWKWKTLDELSEYITSGSRGWKGYLSTSGDAFIRSQDIKQDALIFENPAFVALPEKAEGKRTLVRGGDLLLTITGGNVGKCAFVPILNCNAYVSQHVALIRLHDSSWAEFIHFWMINANGGRNFLSRYIYGDKPGLNLAQVASVPIPIPPKTEKTKILESLRQFQVICNRLAELLDRGPNISKILVKAAVSSITGIATEQKEDVPVKVPQTELIAPLRLGQFPDIKAQAPLATILARHNGEISAKDLYQRFGAEIDAFYAQLKTEVSHGWILEPEVAEMREKFTDRASA